MLDCMATYSLGHNTAQFINIVFARSCSIRHQCVAGARQHTFHCFALCQKKKRVHKRILFPKVNVQTFAVLYYILNCDLSGFHYRILFAGVTNNRFKLHSMCISTVKALTIIVTIVLFPNRTEQENLENINWIWMQISMQFVEARVNGDWHRRRSEGLNKHKLTDKNLFYDLHWVDWWNGRAILGLSNIINMFIGLARISHIMYSEIWRRINFGH